MGTMIAGERHAALLALQKQTDGQTAVVQYLSDTLEYAERELHAYEERYQGKLHHHIILTAAEVLGADMRMITQDGKLRLNGRHLHLYAGALQLPNLPGDKTALPDAMSAVEHMAARLARDLGDPYANAPEDFDRLQAVRQAIYGDRPSPGPYSDIPDSALLTSLKWRDYTIRRLINQPEETGWGAEYISDHAQAHGYTPAFGGWPFWVLLAKIAEEYKRRHAEVQQP